MIVVWGSIEAIARQLDGAIQLTCIAPEKSRAAKAFYRTGIRAIYREHQQTGGRCASYKNL